MFSKGLIDLITLADGASLGSLVSVLQPIRALFLRHVDFLTLIIDYLVAVFAFNLNTINTVDKFKESNKSDT